MSSSRRRWAPTGNVARDIRAAREARGQAAGAQTGGSIDREDLQRIGLMGLLDALRRYGTPDEKFPAYASVRVRGAILDDCVDGTGVRVRFVRRRTRWRRRSRAGEKAGARALERLYVC